MLRLIPRMGDAACEERRKRAFICAILSYILFLVLIFLSFSPEKKKVAASVNVRGCPSAVRWGGHRGKSARVTGNGLQGRGSRVAHVAKMSQNRKIKTIDNARVLKKTGLDSAKKGHKKSVIDNKKKVTATAPLCNKKIERKVRCPGLVVSEKLVEKKSPPSPKKSQKKREKKVACDDLADVKIVEKPLAMQDSPVVESNEDDVHDGPVEITVGSGAAVDGDNGTDENELSRDEYALTCSVGRAWRPPRGLKDGLSARLTVAVSSQGRAESVEIVTSSCVPAYDIAARASLYRTEYPSAFWGKSISVVFGQNG